MIVGGAAIGFYLAFQNGAGPYQWLLSLAGLLLGASCGVVVMVLQRKFHQASLQVIVSGIIGFVLGLGLAELFFSAISGSWRACLFHPLATRPTRSSQRGRRESSQTNRRRKNTSIREFRLWFLCPR